MTILCYHSVERDWPIAVTPRLFARHCDWLSRRTRVVALDELVAAMNGSHAGPNGATAITFDDGFGDFYQDAWPVLTRYGLPATVFLVAATLGPEGRPVDWLDHGLAPPHPLRTVSREQVLEMQAAGIRFGSHSYAHRDLTTLTDEECEWDLRASRELLEDLLQRPVPFLAYPYGRHNERVRDSARRAGYTHAFTLPEGKELPAHHAVPRVGVYGRNGLLTLRLKMSGWYLPLRTSRVFPRPHGEDWLNKSL